jgi:hypothetical protein
MARLALCLALLLPVAATAHAPNVQRDDALAAQLQKERKAWGKERRALVHRLLHTPSVQEAISLAAAIYSVPRWQLESVARCESGGRSSATNHEGSGASGLFQFMPGTFRGTPPGQAGLSIFSPYANALAAGWMVARGGWRAWTCRP